MVTSRDLTPVRTILEPLNHEHGFKLCMVLNITTSSLYLPSGTHLPCPVPFDWPYNHSVDGPIHVSLWADSHTYDGLLLRKRVMRKVVCIDQSTK
jgi:hypothetical protein